MREEWNSIWHSKWLKVVLVAIMVIPAIYSGVFLGSMWDPYGNTKDIPVAVVNQDEPVTYETTVLNIGKDLTTELSKQTSMNFQLVDEETARSGLRDGTYYMMITIPEDFSNHATTLLEKHPKKMELQYTTNPGNNYIATKMDESAMQKIKQQVSETVTKTYADTLFSKIGVLSSGLQEASDGSKALEEGLQSAKQGNQTIEDNLQTLATSTLTFEEGTESFVKGLSSYTTGVASVQEGSGKLQEGLATLQTKSERLATGTSQLVTGSQTLSDGVKGYTAAVDTLKQGSTQLLSHQGALLKGVSNLGLASTTLNNGASAVLTGLQTMSTSLGTSIKQTQPMIEQLQVGNTQSVAQLQLLSQQSEALKQQIAQLKESNEKTIAALTSIQPADETSKKTLEALIAQYQSVDYRQLEGMLNQLSSQSVSLQTLLSKDSQMITGLSTGLAQIKQSLDQQGTSADQMGLIQGMTSLSQGLSQLDQNVNNEQGLVNAVSSYTAGVSTLSQGLSQLTNHNETLVTGASSLQTSLKTVSQSTPVLLQGVQSLYDGSTSLVDGTTKLTSNSPTLLQGASTIASGSIQLHNGASQLYNGSTKLSNAFGALSEGGSTLQSALADGAKQSQLSITDDTIDMLSAPVELQHEELSTVESNGQAMAPYMMSVGLYVSCMAFTLMYPLLKNHTKEKKGLHVWASKASVMYAVSTCMAILMVSALIGINGLAPQQMLETYLIAILIAASFMSMIVFFNITCGKIGAFLVLVFMVFQLGGAAGTYPIETSNQFYQFIHPFMPFTYSVEAFRHTLSTGASVMSDVYVFVGIFCVFSFLSILFYRWISSISKEHYEATLLSKFQ